MLDDLLDSESDLVRPLRVFPWYRGVARSHVYWFCPKRWLDVAVWVESMVWAEAIDWAWAELQGFPQTEALDLPFALDSEGRVVEHPIRHLVCPWCVTRVKVTVLDGMTSHGH